MSPSRPTGSSCISGLIPFFILAFGVPMPRDVQAGAWTLKKGHAWGKITAMSQSTNEHYDNDGWVGEFPARYESRQIYLDLMYGATDQIDVGLQIPYVSRKFVEIDNSMVPLKEEDAKESGIGDLRGFAKINLVRQSGLVAA